MENFDLNACGVSEMSTLEVVMTNGGFDPVSFFFGAIVGGLIYDCYKILCEAAMEVQVEHPEYFNTQPSLRYGK